MSLQGTVIDNDYATFESSTADIMGEERVSRTSFDLI